jgi:hypothetical protein
VKLPFTATVDGYFLAVIDNNVPIYRSDVAMYRDKVSKSRNGKWILDRGN